MPEKEQTMKDVKNLLQTKVHEVYENNTHDFFIIKGRVHQSPKVFGQFVLLGNFSKFLVLGRNEPARTVEHLMFGVRGTLIKGQSGEEKDDQIVNANCKIVYFTQYMKQVCPVCDPNYR